MGLLLWIVDHPWLCAAAIIAGVCGLVTAVCGAVWLVGVLLHGRPAPRWTQSCARHRVHEPPRYPWTRPPRLDPHPDVGEPSGPELPAKPDGPPPGHVWKAPADHDADTQPIPRMKEPAA